MTATRPAPTDAQVEAARPRLLAKLTQCGECIEFTGTRDPKGYGSLRVGKKMLRAHRVAWMLAHETIPEWLVVCHTCDNPACCNVEHLFLGTVAENNADRHAKGRSVMPTNGPDFLRNKTHCPHGHPYSGANLIRRPGGGRHCRTCRQAQSRAARARRALEAAS